MGYLRSRTPHTSGPTARRGENAAVQCQGKQPYASFHAAELQIKNTRRRMPPLDIYKCSICHFWHVGSNPHKPKAK